MRAGAGMILPGIEYVLGWSALVEGRAHETLARMEAIVATRIDEGPYLARALLLRAEVQRVLGDVEAADGSAVAALEIAERLDAASIVAEARLCRARMCIDRSQWIAAADHAQRALERIEERRLVAALPLALEALAEVAGGLANDADAARLLGAAGRARVDHELDPLHHAGRIAALQRPLAGRLPLESLDRARGQGERLGPWEAVAWARRGRGHRKRPPTGWQSLTPTERIVVGHVAAGLTNPQIAERMFVTRGTVKTHLAHVYAKLDLRNRSELAAEAARRQPAR